MIRYDSLLVAHLARELDARLSGRPLRRLRLNGEQWRASLEMEGASLVLDLHPRHGWMRFAPTPPDSVAGVMRRGTRVRRVLAPLDERILLLELAGPHGLDRPPAADDVHRIVIELMTNQWNVLAVDGAGHIRHVLRSRVAGPRALRVGRPYRSPDLTPRSGADAPLSGDEWRRRLAGVAPAERAARLVRDVAWISPLNTGPILGDAGRDPAAAALDASHRRYLAVVPPAPARPVVWVDGEEAASGQPYPVPLPGVVSRPVPSLLTALEGLATEMGAPPASAEQAEWQGPGGAHPAALAGSGLAAEMLELLQARVRRAHRRLAHLRHELEHATAEAPRLRRHADLLLSQAHTLPRGARSARLSDFEGGTIDVTLDPALDAVANAQRWYDEARRRDRAASRLPSLIRRAGLQLARLEDLAAHARAGTLDVGELDELSGPLADRRRADSATGRPGRTRETSAATRGMAGAPVASRRPYRRYRTTGGLEVRVGRGGRDNDELTFHHSSPEDIWLHARDVAGAHVILRWGDAGAGPPARDLAEAAVLAARHSRAHTSGTVAVDWTRRKYVRKPRKSPPGRVLPERVRTVFVEPSEAVERRLRVDGSGTPPEEGPG